MRPEFDRYVVEHSGRLRRLARVLTGDRHAGEDLTQETLALAFRKWSRVSRAGHPHAYVRRMMVNLHLSAERRRPGRAVQLDVLEARSASSGLAFEEMAALREAVAALPHRQRTALVLRFYEDLDVEEIADAMGIGASSVRSALARAVATLRGSTTDTAINPMEDRRA